MYITAPFVKTAGSLIRAQREFEESIAHLTPQRQAELIVIRQIGLDSVRKHVKR